MKTWQLTEAKGPEGLRLVDLPEPKPAANEVIVRVRACSLNYRDLMIASGNYGKTALPLVPLSDGAGEIVATGEGVTRWKMGDRVTGTFFQGWQNGPTPAGIGDRALGGGVDGMLREYVALPGDSIVEIPAHLSFDEGATLPCAAVTAWSALVVDGNLSADQTLLLQGTGGVSIFALQIAKLHGARAIITSSSDEKLSRARGLGADETINYKTTPEWEREVFQITGKQGVQHVVEVGGKDTLVKSLRALAMGGHIYVIGGVSGFGSELPLGDVINRRAVIHGVYVGHRTSFEAMNSAFARAKVKPVIDRVFSFAEAPEAYRYQESGAHFGKVVITFP